jgi:hypothetical protein
MKKFIDDTLKSNGAWSQKRITTYFSLITATIYGFMPVWIDSFDVKEFVFLGFLGLGGFSIYRTQRPNQNKEEVVEDTI